MVAPPSAMAAGAAGRQHDPGLRTSSTPIRLPPHLRRTFAGRRLKFMQGRAADSPARTADHRIRRQSASQQTPSSGQASLQLRMFNLGEL
jgi:hypothetical protein